MGQIDGFLINIDVHTNNANNIKEMVLNRLNDDGLITDDQFKEYSEKWQIIIVKNSWFKKWKNVFQKNQIDEYVFKFVKFED